MKKRFWRKAIWECFTTLFVYTGFFLLYYMVIRGKSLGMINWKSYTTIAVVFVIAHFIGTLLRWKREYKKPTVRLADKKEELLDEKKTME